MEERETRASEVMMQCRFLVLILTGASLLGEIAPSGAVCIAPVPKPVAGGKSLANPAGGNKVQAYSVQIGDKPSATALAEKPVLVDGLARAKAHLVSIKGDGRPVASFKFRFEDYKSDRLCLVFSPLYETWRMRAAAAGGPGCKCQ